MQAKTWIQAACVALLAVAGGVVLLRAPLQRDDHETEVSLRAREGGEAAGEERDAPEFTSMEPERFRPTRWTILDDAGTNHRCNQDGLSQLQNETPCAANPIDPEAIIVGANDYTTGNVVAGYYRTTDGGNSWLQAFYGTGPASIHCDFAGDPAIAADMTGKFYAVYCTYYCQSAQGVYCQTSINNGQTWGSPVPVGTINTTGIEVDKPMAMCDCSPSSPYLNNCYAVWMHIFDNTSIYFSRSTNGGVSFTTPTRISVNNNCWCPSVATGPNGEVYATWFSQDPGRVRFRRSLDGGVTWGADISVATFVGDVWATNPCGSYRITHYPVVACDISDGPNRGTLYLCWAMARTGNNSDIYFCRSTDDGMTWSDTTHINDDATTRMQWWPWMAVHPRTGDVGISWLDRREDPQNCTYAVYGTISSDGGATWCPNFRISDQTINPAESSFLGDYTGATFTSLGFFSSWADARNDVGDAYATWWNNGNELAVRTPNGGEILSIAADCSVAWNFRYAPDSIEIQLNRDYPSDEWESLATVRSADGFWTWQPTEPATTTARIRIIGQHHTTIGDTSDADFSIGLRVTGVVVSRIGNDIRIGWNDIQSPFYRIYSASTCCDTIPTLVGSTNGTVFMDVGAVSDSTKYYVVKASTEP